MKVKAHWNATETKQAQLCQRHIIANRPHDNMQDEDIFNMIADWQDESDYLFASDVIEAIIDHVYNVTHGKIIRK